MGRTRMHRVTILSPHVHSREVSPPHLITWDEGSTYRAIPVPKGLIGTTCRPAGPAPLPLRPGPHPADQRQRLGNRNRCRGSKAYAVCDVVSSFHSQI